MPDSNSEAGISQLQLSLISMDETLVAALEARDKKRLLPLCQEVSRNATVTVGGYVGNCLEQSVVHHVTCLAQGVACLSALVDQLGPDCLTERNQLGNTAVHCAALCQDESWMQVILAASGGRQCFEERGQFRRTAAHFAAQNRHSNSALKWLVMECGSQCLLTADDFGDTAVHLAAECQGSDSMELIKRELGVARFQLLGQWQRTAVHMAAMNEVRNSALKWLAAECGPDCLTVADGDGSTPIHLAAWKQGPDSLQFVADQLGARAFRVRGFNGWTAVHYAAQNISSGLAQLTWCVRELGPACLLDKDCENATPAHLAAQCQDGSCLRFITDSLGVWALGLADARGVTVADQAARNSKSSGTLESISVLQPRLSGNFRSWDFILENGIKQSVGEGRFVEVYKVLTGRNQTLAAQVVNLTAFSDDGRLRRVIRHEKRALRALKAIQHPNIVQFLKCEERTDSSEFFIFTELIAGQSLSDKIHRQHQPLDEAEVVRVSRQICTALNFLHTRAPAILHRDINCDNIMVTSEGVIRLIDFGIAKEIFIEATADYLAQNLFRSCYFMAPELFRDAPRAVYTPQTDVWALGCSLYQMLRMLPPNGDLEIQQIPQAVVTEAMPEPAGSDGLCEFYRRCVARDPGERADTAELLGHRFLNDFKATAAALDLHVQKARSRACCIL